MFCVVNRSVSVRHGESGPSRWTPASHRDTPCSLMEPIWTQEGLPVDTGDRECQGLLSKCLPNS